MPKHDSDSNSSTKGTGFFRKILDGIRDNLISQLVLWICGGGLLTAIAQVVRTLRNHPFEWYFVALVFVISVLSTAVVMFLLITRSSVKQQDSASQIQNLPVAPVLATSQSQFDFDQYFATAYYSPLAEEIKQKIALALNKYQQPAQREDVLLRFIGSGLVAYVYDAAWVYLYRSQLLMLQELNARTLSLAETQGFYDAAVRQYPNEYTRYSFDNWLSWVRNEGFIVQHGTIVCITPRGTDFLKYLVHWRKSAQHKKL